MVVVTPEDAVSPATVRQATGLGITGYYRILQDITGYFRILQDITGYYRTLQEFTGYYMILQDITENITVLTDNVLCHGPLGRPYPGTFPALCFNRWLCYTNYQHNHLVMRLKLNCLVDLESSYSYYYVLYIY